MSVWDYFKKYYYCQKKLGFYLDLSKIGISDGLDPSLVAKVSKAIIQMQELEAGAEANPDEKRMVGHYWFRNSDLAPSPEIKHEIDSSIDSIKDFVKSVHSGRLKGSTGKKFKSALIIGIGGSALGPQFASRALNRVKLDFKLHFFDNTDPNGIELVISQIQDLEETLCLVISKSGGTVETRNGMLAAQKLFESKGIDFSAHAVAVTGAGSKLDTLAIDSAWLKRFPIWDWLGGRTSQIGPVGLLPAALEGHEIDLLLAGASEMDKLTRQVELENNPAALLAAAWHHLGSGTGQRNMVILPYRDRLEYFSRYLQQLVMESLGKEHDLSGKKVEQGMTVFGNKGSTDQHAYVQQLRDGHDDFFVNFIEVRDDLSLLGSQDLISSLEVEPDIRVGDYLYGFYRGTRQALAEKNRPSVSITFDTFTERELGMLIALYERAVGLYAFMINVNAYNQPGVEAGKKASENIIALQKEVLSFLRTSEVAISATEVATGLGNQEQTEEIFLLMRRLVVNGYLQVDDSTEYFDAKFKLN